MNDVSGFAGLDNFAGVVRVNDGQLRSHVDGVVRETVEQSVNALLDAEADALCGAKRYERHPERADTRAGHYERQLQTKAGAVALKVPRLRSLPFQTQIIDRCRLHIAVPLIQKPVWSTFSLPPLVPRTRQVVDEMELEMK